MRNIEKQITNYFNDRIDFYKRLMVLKKDGKEDDVAIKEQIKYNRARFPKDVKTDELESRISKRIRSVAKLYDGISGYYESESLATSYILQIIRMAIEEVENEKDNSRI